MKSIVVLPVPLDSDRVWSQFRSYIERFCATWKQFPPGTDVELYAICCNADPDESVRRLFLNLPTAFLRYDGEGADLGAQQWFAQQIGGNPFLINATSRMYFHREGWARKLVSARELYGPGLYGMSASYEGGTLHLCTRGHCLDAQDFRAYPTVITSRNMGVFFECGGGNLLRWFEEQGGEARMVYWDGIWQKKDWFERPNTFRKGHQRNMLAWDKHTDFWASADAERKQQLERMLLGKSDHPSKAAGPLKVAGIMPLKYDPEKSTLENSVKDIIRICDEFIVLWDTPETLGPNRIEGNVTEYVTVEGGDGAWSDWSNRAVLMVRAAKYGCRWCLQLDDDETLGPSLTRERIRELIDKCEADGYGQVVVKVRTAWDDAHWRKDGVFGQMVKSLLVKNPYMLQRPEFEYGPDYQLHHFPTLNLPHLLVDDFILHHGMRTRSLREKNVEKYQKLDPDNRFSGVRYDYLLSTDGIVLEPLTL